MTYTNLGRARLFQRVARIAVILSALSSASTWGATLVGHWNFDEGSGIVANDTSGAGNTGHLINTPGWIAGQSGEALDFAPNGSSYVSVAAATSLANLNRTGMTVAAWIRPRSGGNIGRILDKDNNDVGWFFAMSGAKQVRFQVDQFPATQPSRLSSAVIATNQWQHVAATWDGSVKGANIHIYVNGVLADSSTTDGAGAADDDSASVLDIGNRHIDLQRAFDGGIDDVRIYSGVLSAADINALATGSTPPPPSDTQAPTVPSGLSTSNITTDSLTLSWTASTDLPSSGAAGVGGYYVYRNGGSTPIATITSGTSFSDSGLNSGTAYSYQVAAFDKASPPNVSVHSVSASATTQTATTTPPSGLTGGDIGTVGAKGSSAASGSSYTVRGSGADIWGTADAFQFDSQSITGDGSITAHLVSLSQPNSWAKAGVMFRESSAAGSKFAAMLISAAHGSEAEARTSTNGSAVGTAGSAVNAPYWVRVTRAGNVLSTYLSADGTTWKSVTSFTVPMVATVNVGLAVTAHLRGSLATAVFDNVSISGSTSTPPPQSITVTPPIATLTEGSSQQFTAVTSGGTTVIWSVDGITGGNGSVGTVSSSGLYTTGSAPGVHKVVATSTVDTSKSGSASAAVTDLSGVYTYHNNTSRDGSNTHEYALTPNNVNTAHFGKIASCATDGTISGQPLWIANQVINGVRRNAVFVVTQHDGLFAFDADASPCVKLWSANLIDGSHGGTNGETPIPYTQIGLAVGDVQPEIGISSTPVIDAATGTLYVVSKSIDPAKNYIQRLHAINLLTGAEKSGSPVALAGSYPGTAEGGTSVAFSSKQEHARPGLTLANGMIYIAFSSHEDSSPWYGWVMGYQYDGSSFTQNAIVNLSPNGGHGGIWMGGGAPAVDASGKLYVITGNGHFDATTQDYGDSLVQLTSNLTVSQYFTPSAQLTDEQNDKDFGSGGAALLADLPAGNTVIHALICGGKDHGLFVLNRDLLGGFGDAAAVQKIEFSNGIFGTGALWNNNFYLAGLNGPLQQYKLNTSNAQFSKAATSSHTYGFPGASPSVSASGSSNGVVWTLDDGLYCTHNAHSCAPAVLYAHDASNVGVELWNSSQTPADKAGNAVKFSVPTVANGKVYVGTRGNNTGGATSSTSVPGELEIYGLKN